MTNTTSGQSSNSDDNKQPDIPIVNPDDSGKYIQGIVLQYGYDSVSGIWGAGYSYDNGAHFFVTDTVYGRKYRQEDADRLYPYLKQYFGTPSSGSTSGGPVTSSIAWPDIIGKPDLVTKDELDERFDTFTPAINSIDWSRITNKPDLVTSGELDQRLANLKPSSSSPGEDKPQSSSNSSTISLSGSAMTIDVDKGTIAFNGEMADPAGVEHKQELQAAVNQAKGTVDQTNVDVTSASNAVSALQSEGPAANKSATPLSDWSGFESASPYPNSYYDLNFTTPIPDDADNATFTIDIQEWVSNASNSITVTLLGDDKATKTIYNQAAQSQSQKIVLKVDHGSMIRGLHFTGSNLYITAANVSVSWTTKGYTPDEMTSASAALSDAQIAASNANVALSSAQSEYDNYEIKQVPYTLNVDKDGISYTADDKTTQLLSIHEKEEKKTNQIDKSNVSSNKMPADYSDGIFYEQKLATAVDINRSDYASDAQSGTTGILTTKAITVDKKKMARQRFELLDNDYPLTLERNGADSSWNDWHGVTNWN